MWCGCIGFGRLIGNKMNISSSLRLLHRSRFVLQPLQRNYAVVKPGGPSIAGLGKKKKATGAAQTTQKVVLEVEKDPKKLVNFVCGSNIMQTGEDIAIKPDSEYPDWLWSIHTGPAKKLQDFEEGTKEYYLKLKQINIKKALRLRSYKKVKNA